MKIIKLTKTIALLFLVSIALFSCSSKDDGDPVNPPSIKVKSISLNKTAISKTVGETEQLTATIKPSDATNKNVTWKSSNNEVASVDAKGKLTAKEEGTAVISVSTKDGNKSDKCTVTVQNKVVAVTGVSLNKTAISKTVGETEQLTATVKPSDATNKNVTWKSSNNEVASVDAEGKLTAKKEGTAVISVSTKDGNKSDKCTVTVKATTPYVRMETTKDRVSFWIDAAEADRPDCWIDLNNNSQRDKGEEIAFKNDKAYTPTTETITIYGKVTLLRCYDNLLTKLDLSNNEKLEEILCSSNQLTKLDLSKNTNLEYISCENNQLTKLDLSKNTNLEYISCYNNQLTKLNLSNGKKLKKLYCGDNKLTELDISSNTKLEEFICSKNRLTKLDVNKNTNLKGLWCVDNQLTKLDVSKNTKLKEIWCNNNKLLKSLNLANGKNGILTKVNAEYCPNLSCIQIDKGFTPNEYWDKDSAAKWNNTGNPCK